MRLQANQLMQLRMIEGVRYPNGFPSHMLHVWYIYLHSAHLGFVYSALIRFDEHIYPIFAVINTTGKMHIAYIALVS